MTPAVVRDYAPMARKQPGRLAHLAAKCDAESQRAFDAGHKSLALHMKAKAEWMRLALSAQRRCDRCGRPLSNELSQARGYGPICSHKAGR